MSFEDLFQTPDSERQQFLAGVFNLLSAEIVRCWGTDKQARFTITEKPLLRERRGSRGVTLDYALQTGKRLYVAMMRCDPLADGPLVDVSQIEALVTTRTFSTFLDVSRKPANYVVVMDGEEVAVEGSILIWGSASVRAQRAVKKAYDFHAILTMESILGDLTQWQNREFQMLLDRRIAWSHDFYRGLRQIK